MRYIFIISGMLFLFSSCSVFQKSDEVIELSQKVDSLIQKVDALTEQNKALDEEFTWIENEMVKISALNVSKQATPVTTPTAKAAEKVNKDWQCKAITNSGKRCSRPALEDSKYCWQHIKTYEPDMHGKPENKATPAGSVPATPEGK